MIDINRLWIFARTAPKFLKYLAYSKLLQVCKFFGDNVLGPATILFESLNLTGQKPIEHGRLEAEFHI